MIKKILLGLAVVVAAILIAAAFQSDDYRVERSTAVSAPPAAAFDLVNDLHKWDAWSPWAKLDPDMKTTHSGPPAGTGAVYSWEGNSQVGSGRMTITESRPNERVRLRLDFLKPFESSSDVEFTFTPRGGQTEVNWSMSGKKNYLSKVMCLFVSMDKMIGGDFEKGLAGIKAAAEASR